MDAGQRHHPSPEPVVVHLAGEIDLAEVAALRSRLAAAGEDSPGGVVVDLADVAFLSCAGLGPLLEAQRHLGGRLWLGRISPPVRMLLRLTGLDATFGRTGESDMTTSPGRSPTGRRGGRERPLPTGGARWEQARGLVIGVLGCDAHDAAQLLEDAARRNDLSIDDVVTTLTVLAAAPMHRDVLRSAMRSLLRHDEASASPTDRVAGDRATRS